MRALARVLEFTWNHPLNRGRRLAAIRRLLSWQFAARALSRPVLLPFVDDTFLVTELGMSGATGNWYCGLHEYCEMLFVLRLLREEDLFVDVGANVGAYTVMVAGAVRARTICFEPIPATFARLERNLAANGLTHLVEALQLGIADLEGSLRFTATQDTVNHVATLDELEGSIEVPVTTLDRIVGTRGPSLIKIDIEGQELAAIRGGRAVLTQPSLMAVLMETNESGSRYGAEDRLLRSEMKGLGFQSYSYDPFSNDLRPAEHGAANTLFIRDYEKVVGRLRSARRFRLCNGTF